MARWRLTCGHYLKTIPPVFWEYKEIDRNTGKNVVRRFEVPTLLDPNDPGDWNHRDGFGNGELVVAHEGKTEFTKDIIFLGPPTPDMVPLDKEAEEISAGYAKNWKHPIESLSDRYADGIMESMQKEMASVMSKSNQPSSIEGFSELMAAMTTIMKQNAELLAKLANPLMQVQPNGTIASVQR